MSNPAINEIKKFQIDHPKLFNYYDCNYLETLTNNQYLIKFDRFEKFEDARAAIQKLTKHFIPCGILWEGCLKPTEQQGYLVFIDKIGASNGGILGSARQYQEQLEARTGSTKPLIILMWNR